MIKSIKNDKDRVVNFPKLMTSMLGNLAVLMSEPGIGVVVGGGDSQYELGHYSTKWTMSEFSDAGVDCEIRIKTRKGCTYANLMEEPSNGLILLMTRNGAGTVLVPNKVLSVGFHSKAWYREGLTGYYGEVFLRNNYEEER